MSYRDKLKLKHDGELVFLNGWFGTEPQKRRSIEFSAVGNWSQWRTVSCWKRCTFFTSVPGPFIITANTYAFSLIMLWESVFEVRFAEINLPKWQFERVLTLVASAGKHIALLQNLKVGCS